MVAGWLVSGLCAAAVAAPSLPPPINISTPSDAGPARAVPADQAGVIRAARSSPVRRESLRNGLRVLINEQPQEDMVSAELLIQVGAVDEPTQIEGISQIIQQLLTNRVSDAPDGTDRIEETACQFQITPELDFVRISLTSTRQDFPGLLKAVADALTRRPVTEAELDKVKSKIQLSLDENENSKVQIYDIFRQCFYRYHPYKRMSRVGQAVLDRVKVKTITDFLDNNYVANRMVLSICGRVDRNEALDWAKERFGAIPQHTAESVEVSWEPQPTEKEVYLSAGGRNVGWLFVGYPAPSAPSRDYVAMRLINTLLGEGLSSRLFTEIREKRSLCYELGSMYPILKGPAHFVTYTVTKPNQVWPARKQLLIEIDRLKKDGVGPKELEETKRKVIGTYLAERETNSGRAYQAALAELVGLGFEFDSQFMRLLEAVTPADIQNVAQHYLGNPTLIVARPRGIYFDL